MGFIDNYISVAFWFFYLFSKIYVDYSIIKTFNQSPHRFH